MEHWVERPSDPLDLTLSWRAPESVPDRLRWAVGVLSVRGPQPTFRYLQGEEFCQANLGRDEAQLEAYGYRGYPTFSWRPGEGQEFVSGVLDAFLRRLPPTVRPDFSKYLELFRYRGTPLSPMKLLALTAAKLPSDGFSLVDRLDPMSTACDLVLEIVGFRHRVQKPQRLRNGIELRLVAEPDHQIDPSAVKVQVEDRTIGYINRLQASSVSTWMRTRSVSCWLLRMNGRPDSPVAYAFLRMRDNKSALAA